MKKKSKTIRTQNNSCENVDELKESKKNKSKTKVKKKKIKVNFNVIGGFVMLFSFIGMIATIITLSVNRVQISSLGHYTDKAYASERITLDDVLEMHDSDTYYVFIYKDDCSGCKNVESSVLKYIKNGPRPLYLLDGDKYKKQLLEIDYETNTYKSNYAVSDINELRVPQYPCLLLIQKGEIIAHSITASSIKNQLILR